RPVPPTHPRSRPLRRVSAHTTLVRAWRRRHRMFNVRPMVATAALSAVLLAGCATAAPGTDPSASSSGSSPEPTASASAEPSGPFAFTAATVDGGTLDGESLKGKDV